MRGVGRGSRETEMDGVRSVAVQGHRYGERQFTDAQRRSGRDFGKMTSQEVGGGGIMSKDRECEFVCERGERRRPGGRCGGKKKKMGKFMEENLERRGREVPK